MMKKRILSLLLTTLLLLSALSLPCLSETIILKSGRKLQDKIIKRTDKYIKVEITGVPVTFYMDEIESIDGKKISLIKETIANSTEVREKNSLEDIKYSNVGMLLKRANDFYKQGEYKKAAEDYEKIIALEPNHYEALCFLCASRGQTGEYSEAIEVCKKAIEISPKDPGAYLNLGMIYRNLSQYENEIFNFKEAIKYSKLSKISAKAYANLGFTYVILGEYDNAQMNFEKAIEYDPLNYEAYNWLGFCYYKRGDFETAKKFYLKSIEINSDYGAPYNGLGLIYQQLGDYKKAKEYYQKQVDILRRQNNEQAAQELEQLIRKELP